MKWLLASFAALLLAPQAQAALRITDLQPTQDERLGPRGPVRIAARVQDAGPGVDPKSIVLRVDGADVTRHVKFERGQVVYFEHLPPGRHRAELAVRDRAGNATQAAWTFRVSGRGFIWQDEAEEDDEEYDFTWPFWGRW
ncbi:hypothetical protein [Ramlibacter albus]|uniref:Carboxypeptidase regulatory-like domain-containing protein n=1 Tax=Ramlibacter albus TaxID=2079448 RepID=A0A923MA68_9BURK|nr:hypothetical protein [Ramlibacter albus]MBC5765731.1 hypothetical protein [Ramlibacter albus]